MANGVVSHFIPGTYSKISKHITQNNLNSFFVKKKFSVHKKGTKFDKNGNLINKWSDESTKRSYEKADCFVNEYNIITDETTKL
jgi:hypothetical protein